jgi:succinoglycan biosynthesis transport protein ExoP
MVTAKELETNAQSFKSIYESFLQRYTEIVQQQSFPVTQARLVTPATIPLSRSSPLIVIVLLASVVAGLATGVLLGLVRELLENALRTHDDVRNATGLDVVAVLPKIGFEGGSGSSEATFTGLLRSPWSPLRALAETASANRRSAPLGKSDETAIASPIDSLFKNSRPNGYDPAFMLKYASRHPQSQFTEGLRAVKLALQLNAIGDQVKTIGVVSSIPGEGKSTVSANLASVLAADGQRVLLLDADLRAPTLTKRLGARPRNELAGDSGTAQPNKLITRVANFDFLPSAISLEDTDSSAVLGSDRMLAFMEMLKRHYDVVVVDLPPVLPLVDAVVAGRFIDKYLFVIEWGKTNRNAVRIACESIQEAGGDILGCVFDKVDQRAYARVEGYAGVSGYYHRYGQYFS